MTDTDALEQAARAARDANVWAYIWGRSRPREPEPSEPEVRYMRAVDPDVILRLIAAVREADALRGALRAVMAESFRNTDAYVAAAALLAEPAAGEREP